MQRRGSRGLIVRFCVAALPWLVVLGACSEAEDDPCVPIGRYQAGKGLNGSDYVPCCEGLNEIFRLVPTKDAEGANICAEPIGREYACIPGTCGDGTCEEPERGCGCPEDCPPFPDENE